MYVMYFTQFELQKAFYERYVIQNVLIILGQDFLQAFIVCHSSSINKVFWNSWHVNYDQDSIYD